MGKPVYLREFDRVLDVKSGQSIMSAALRAGLAYPAEPGCRQGTCGQCKSLLIEGEVRLLAGCAETLTQDEQRSGRILVCQVSPRTACDIALVDRMDPADHPNRTIDGKLRCIDAPTPEIRVLTFEDRSDTPFEFSPGQFASIEFEPRNLGARDYSMASLPRAREILFHIRLAQGEVSDYIARRLKPGAEVRLSGPYGAAYLRNYHKGPIIVACGGTGMAPALSIVAAALAAGHPSPVRAYIGARNKRALYALPQFDRLAARYRQLTVIPLVSDEPGRVSIRQGLVGDALADDLRDGHITVQSAKVYLSGPPAMVDHCRAVLRHVEFPPRDLHFDSFLGMREKARAGMVTRRDFGMGS